MKSKVANIRGKSARARTTTTTSAEKASFIASFRSPSDTKTRAENSFRDGCRVTLPTTEDHPLLRLHFQAVILVFLPHLA